MALIITSFSKDSSSGNESCAMQISDEMPNGVSDTQLKERLDILC